MLTLGRTACILHHRHIHHSVIPTTPHWSMYIKCG